jgi:hypothetical protein
MSLDPRPRYLLAGALFLVAAVIALFIGGPLPALLFAVIAAVLFYLAGRVKTVP